MKTIQEILAEANLSEDQVGQIAEMVEEARLDERQKLREVHVAEIQKLTESKDHAIKSLVHEAIGLNKKLDEKVIEKPKRISAMVTADIAVGIDLDNGGSLAFTVTDKSGSAVAELNKPDSDAIKAWFTNLSEAVKKKLKESDDGDADDEPGSKEGEDNDADDESEAEMEERISRRIYAEVDAQLAEALEPLANKVRQARAYSMLREKFNVIAESVIPHLNGSTSTELVAESVQAYTILALEKERDALLAERREKEMQSLFEKRTTGMAVTTIEKVQTLVESAKPASLQDYDDFLTVAIQTVKSGVAQSTQDLSEGKVVEPTKPATRVQEYASKL